MQMHSDPRAGSVTITGLLINLGGNTLLGVVFPAVVMLSAIVIWLPGQVPVAVLGRRQLR